MSQTKVSDALRNVTTVDGTKINAVDAAKITTGTVDNARITLDAAEIPDLDAAKITTGDIALARLDNAPATDTSALEYNIAILAFKVASANQLAKFQMVDQVIDEYQDATGIDAGASTNAQIAISAAHGTATGTITVVA